MGEALEEGDSQQLYVDDPGDSLCHHEEVVAENETGEQVDHVVTSEHHHKHYLADKSDCRINEHLLLSVSSKLKHHDDGS